MSSYKRSRAAYEADLQAQQSPYVTFGTPLPPLDPDARDDGSYVPVWKQEVRDERGRKRLHGAFTGGWSAGYFNTVGSKEGWTPSTFVSSRTNRRKDDPKAAVAAQQRPEDFMDEEDLADAEEARKIQTSDAFAGLGLTESDAVRASGLAGLLRVEGETMGTRLLRKMGWKEGQGIGPKVRRGARLEVGKSRAAGGGDDGAATYLFAPENVRMISFVKKTDRKGLGYEGQAPLAPLSRRLGTARGAESDEEEDEDFGRPRTSINLGAKKKAAKPRSGIGIGVLNDTGSDDEDPYEIGPRISYSRVIGGDKKKKKKKEAVATTAVNPALKTKPTFVPRRGALARVALGVRKCHDGRLPLDGFIFGQEDDPLIFMISSEGKYPPPAIPADWKSARQPKTKPGGGPASYVSTADAAKASALDPKSRAALLGEKPLPGKSVFDFLSSSARERLAAVTGRTDLPQAKGEIPEGYALTEEEKLQQLLGEIPKLERETAVAALTRAAAGSGPYGDDEAKRGRYRAYLENQAGYGPAPAARPPKATSEDWLREFHEFYNVARIFKPMTGMMAARFTTSSASKLSTGSDGKGGGGGGDLVTRPPAKPADPAEEAAKMGMYGHMTRSVADFYPSRLLCKRFNVKPPAHVQAEQEAEARSGPQQGGPAAGHYGGGGGGGGGGESAQAALGMDLVQPDMSRQPAGGPPPAEASASARSPGLAPPDSGRARDAPVDASRNDALEGKRAGEEVFKAIFGDSSDEED